MFEGISTSFLPVSVACVKYQIIYLSLYNPETVPDPSLIVSKAFYHLFWADFFLLTVPASLLYLPVKLSAFGLAAIYNILNGYTPHEYITYLWGILFACCLRMGETGNCRGESAAD